MKMILVLLAFAAAQAQAQIRHPDEILTVLKCERAVNIPDLGMSVEVRQGGIAGLTSIEVENFYLGHSTRENYYVSPVVAQPASANQPAIYEGNQIRLTINIQSALDAKGGTPATLELYDSAGHVQTTQLSCQAVLNTL
jgi:hypothetical protein